MITPVGGSFRTGRTLPPEWCESASNLDPAPIEHQIIEAEAELLILGVFDRRPTVTPSSFSKIVWLQPVTAVWSGVKIGRRFTVTPSFAATRVGCTCPEDISDQSDR